MKKIIVILSLIIGCSVSLQAMEDPRDIKHGAKEKETKQPRGQKRNEPESNRTKTLFPIIKRTKVESPKSLKDLSLNVARENYFAQLQNSKKISHAKSENGENIVEYEKMPFVQHFNDLPEDLKGEAIEGNYNETLLHTISSMQDLENLRAMGVLKPEYINKKNGNGQTVINALIERGHCDIAQYLVEEFGFQLDVDSSDKYDYDPLQNAIIKEDINLAVRIAQVLLNQNKKLVKPYGHGYSCDTISLIIDRNLFELLPLVTINNSDLRRRQVIQFHYQYALDNEKVQSALYFGIMYNLANDQIVKELIERGADIDAFYFYELNQSIFNSTLLMLTILHIIQNGTFNLCINNGASLNLKECREASALMFAIVNQNEEAIRALLKAGADVNIADNMGSTSIMIAAYYMPSIISLLLEKNPNLEAKNNIGRTALQIAIVMQKEESAHALLKAGADVNNVDNSGNTPLMFAAKNMPSIIPLLLERGVELEAKNDLHNTALHVAVEYKNNEAIQELLKAGANIYAVGDKGISVLEAAQQSGSEEIMNLFAPYV